MNKPVYPPRRFGPTALEYAAGVALLALAGLSLQGRNPVPSSCGGRPEAA